MRRVAVLLGLLWLAALGISSLGAMPQVIVQRATLPPTWTPTRTLTPTVTASVTRTPSPTSTLTQAQLCEQFLIINDFESGYSFDYIDVFTVIVGSEVPDTAVRLLLTHRLSGEALGFDVPGGGYVGVQVPMDVLPRTGLYDWSLVLYDVAEPDADTAPACEETGFFFAGRPEWVTPPTPTPDPLVGTAPPQPVLPTSSIIFPTLTIPPASSATSTRDILFTTPEPIPSQPTVFQASVTPRSVDTGTPDPLRSTAPPQPTLPPLAASSPEGPRAIPIPTEFFPVLTPQNPITPDTGS